MSRRRLLLAPLAAALLLPAAAGADGSCPADVCPPAPAPRALHAGPPALTLERVGSPRAAAATRARRTLTVRVCVDRDTLVALSVRRRARGAVVVERRTSDFVPAGCRIHRIVLERAGESRSVVVHAVDAAGQLTVRRLEPR